MKVKIKGVKNYWVVHVNNFVLCARYEVFLAENIRAWAQEKIDAGWDPIEIKLELL